MNALIKAISLSSFLLAFGCASDPKFSETRANAAPVAAGLGRIYVYRLYKFSGSALSPEIAVNGEQVGHAGAGKFFYFDRPPGKYEVKGTVGNRVRLDLAAAQTRYVRFAIVGIGTRPHVIPKEVDQTTALREMQKCRLSMENADRSPK